MQKIVPQNAVLIPEQAEKVFAGEIFDVYQWPQTMFNDSRETFEMLRRPDTVLVLAIVDDQIIVNDEEQPNSGKRLSLPGGRVDATDTGTLFAAKRELHEETGYEFAQWRLIRVDQPHTKLEWFIYLYLAFDGKQVAAPHLDAGERIEVSKYDFTALKDLVMQGQGYLGETRSVFESTESAKDLLALPEFSGRQIDR